MYHFWKWRTHRLVCKMKKAGAKAGLSLDGYTDDQISEGFRQLYE